MTLLRWQVALMAIVVFGGVLNAQNLALSATATNSGGGTPPSYGPDKMNDGSQSTRQWLSTSSSSHWAQLTWAAPQLIESVTTRQSGPTSTRFMTQATVQYWDGNSWVVDSSWDVSATMPLDYTHTLTTPRATTAIRLVNIVCVGSQASNPWIKEWEATEPNAPILRANAVTGSTQNVTANQAGEITAGRFDLAMNSLGSATLSSIEISALGTGNDSTAYGSVALYRDVNSNNTYDSGTDVQIGTTASGFPSDNGTLAFAVVGSEQAFAANETKTYFIVVTMGGAGSPPETLSFQVSALSVSGTGTVYGLGSAVMDGLIVVGDEVTVDSGNFSAGPGIVPDALTDLPIGSFELAASVTSAQSITSISVHQTGSIADGDVTAVKLWNDANNNGTIDTGEAIFGNAQTLSGGVATFTGAPLISLATSASVNVIVTISYNSIANGTTMGFSMTASSDIANTPGSAREVTAPNAPTYTKYLINSFPYVQNFDAFTLGTNPSVPIPFPEGWFNDLSDGGLDWGADYGTTPSNAGPTSDHTNGTNSSNARFIYVEDSTLNSSNDPMNVLTPPIDISGLTLPLVEFWLIAQNNNNPAYENTLHYDLIDVTTGNITNDFVTAHKGLLSTWTLQTIDLSSVTASIIQIRFRAEGTGSSFYCDLAIDDFSVRDLPDINVKNGSNMTVAAGGTDAVGTVQNTVTTTLNYTIENNGGVDLTVSTVTFANHSNVSPSATVLSSSPAATVTAGSTTTFDVQFNPIGAGAFQFDVTVTTNDPDTPNYTFTVSGTGQANAGPTISIPTTGSNWQANGSNFELFVDPGAAINDSLTADDPTPDNITITVTPPATTLTTLTTSPVTGGGTASTISMDWVGTADATNAPTGYVWQIQISDGITNVNFTATIFVNDLAPTSAAGTSATGGNGQGTATPYTGSALVGSTAALTLADMTNPNTGQAMTLGTITPDAGNPAGGSGFTVTFVADSIVLTPTAALQLADVGTHAFAVDIDDAGNTTTVYVSVDVVTPEIDVARNATPIADGGTDTITGALAGQSMVLTYDITNNGTSDLTITTVVLSTLVNCTANVTANPAGTVTPTNSTSFAVTVTPGVGAFSFDIAINNDDVDEDPYDIAASGNAAAAPEIDVDRAGTPIADGGSDAPTTTYTGTGNDLVYTITNNGTSDLIITSITTGGLVNCTATVTVPATSPIAPGNSADFTVQYTPTADGPTSFTISIVNNDANESPYDITVNATSTPAPSSGGSGGGGGGGCASSTDSTLPVMALLALFMLGAVVYRRRRA
ncbi:MAG: DUF1573 domain-containing protein [Planctomycetes bacterium]|nr:DUF1573 domain-containing protein [Planctomycetota bacterium]